MLEVRVPEFKMPPTETISVGIPCWRTNIQTLFLKSLCEILLNRDLPIVEVYIAQNLNVASARNEIVEKTKGTHILMIDPDMHFTSEDVKKLFKADKNIIAGLYFRRKSPHYPLMFKKQGIQYHSILKYPRGIMEVDGAGTGFMMIKREVFKKRDENKPWFYHEPDYSGSDNMTDDLYFCDWASKETPIYVDTSVKLGHVGEQEIGEREFVKSYIELKSQKHEHGELTIPEELLT
jgi:glycosyltransferase involved in cell wall biosynthesis